MAAYAADTTPREHFRAAQRKRDATADSLYRVIGGSCVCACITLVLCGLITTGAIGALALGGIQLVAMPQFILHRIEVLTAMTTDDSGRSNDAVHQSSAAFGTAARIYEADKTSVNLPVWLRLSVEEQRGAGSRAAAAEQRTGGVQVARVEFEARHGQSMVPISVRALRASCAHVNALLTRDSKSAMTCASVPVDIVFALRTMPRRWRWQSAADQRERDPAQWTWSASTRGPDGPWRAMGPAHQRFPMVNNRSRLSRWAPVDGHAALRAARGQSFVTARNGSLQLSTAVAPAPPRRPKVWLARYEVREGRGKRDASSLTSQRLFACAGRMTELLAGFTPIALPVFRGASPWGRIHRHEVLAEWLTQGTADGTIDERDLIWVVDGSDALVARSASSETEIEAKFVAATRGARDGVLFNAGCRCVPRSPLCAVMEEAAGSGDFKYLDGGAMIGRARGLTRLVAALLALTPIKVNSKRGDDQQLLQELCYGASVAAARGTVTCHVDTRSALMLNMYPSSERGARLEPSCQLARFKRPWPATTSAAVAAVRTHFPRWMLRPTQDVRPCIGNRASLCFTDPSTGGQPIVLHFDGRSAAREAAQDVHALQLSAFLRAMPFRTDASARKAHLDSDVYVMSAANRVTRKRWANHQYATFAGKRDASNGNKSELALAMHTLKFRDFCAVSGEKSVAKEFATALGIVVDGHH
jgi:hypothetical protein